MDSVDLQAAREGFAIKRAFRSVTRRGRQASFAPVPKHMRATKVISKSNPRWLKDLLSGL